MPDLRETLDQRGKAYGPFSTHAEIVQALKAIMHATPGWGMMTAAERECTDMVLHKLGRAGNGDPHLHDHWHDIAGYATLVADLCIPSATPDVSAQTSGHTQHHRI